MKRTVNETHRSVMFYNADYFLTYYYFLMKGYMVHADKVHHKQLTTTRTAQNQNKKQHGCKSI